MSDQAHAPSTRLPFRLFTLCCLLIFASFAHAQRTPPEPTLSGHVTDTTGALIPGARVELQSTTGAVILTTAADSSGHYAFTTADPGSYIIVSTADGFASFRSELITIALGKPRTLEIHLPIASEVQQIDVPADSGMDTDPNKNGDSFTLKGRTVDDLPVDPGQMSQELNALAGSDSPELRIDGFSGGSMPPKNTIREIRINANPFSAQNDTNPVNGMIEIFTKPGGNEFHGQIYAFGNSSALNALSPFVKEAPAYHSFNIFANISGPITKHTSFFFSGSHNTDDENSVINAQILDPAGTPISFTQAVATPSRNDNYTLRIDTSLGKKSTVIARYSITNSAQTNAGIGNLSLASQGYNSSATTQTLQLSNSQIISAKIVNDTRFQYIRSRNNQTPNSTAQSIIVQGAFNGGGNSSGVYRDNQDRYELQNYVSAALGTHFLTFGGRLRIGRDANYSRSNYNGQFIFSSLDTYKAGIASQYSVTTGTPSAIVSLTDVGLFIQDDWKIRPNLTLSPGLRFESQDHISDHADWAPRLAVAYGFGAPKGKPQKYTLRAGSGIFYSRFASSSVLQAERQDGISQRQFVINTPGTYPNPPVLNSAVPSAIYKISPTYRSPYFIANRISLQRSFGAYGSITTTYLYNRGVHSQLMLNVNAPLPGTYNPADPTSGTRPLGGNQNVYQYTSEGVYRSNRLSTNFFLHTKKRFTMFGYYMLRFDKTDASSAGDFPSNQYDIGADYGRSSNDNHNVLTLGGSFTLPFGFETGAFINTVSSSPFNIVVGQDLNGDAQFNDRPSFATDLSRPSVVKTAYGNFDTSPIAGQTIIPRNYGVGPSTFVVNAMLNRDFSFGPEIKPPAPPPPPKAATTTATKPGTKSDAKPDTKSEDKAPAKPAPKPPPIQRKYTFTFYVFSQNVLNHVNLAPPVGTLSSPLFGKSVTLSNGFGSSSGSANRMVSVNLAFRF